MGSIMDIKDVRTLSAQLSALSQAEKKFSQNLSTLCDLAASHAASATAAQSELTTATAAHAAVVARVDMHSAARALLSSVDQAARKLAAVGDKTTELAQAVDAAEDAASQVRSSAVAECGTAAVDALSALLRDLGAALDGSWARWLISTDAKTLFQGARALALQPPGDLASGVDGLQAERMALATLREHQALAARMDALEAGAGACGASQRWYNGLFSNCVARTREDLRVACDQALVGGQAPQSVFLAALAEAAGTAAKAHRAASSVFALLTPSTEESAEGAPLVGLAGSTGLDEAESIELAREFTAAMDAKQTELQQQLVLSSASASRAFAEELGAVLKRQQGASDVLVTCALTPRGRRALSRVAEATERFEIDLQARIAEEHGDLS